MTQTVPEALNSGNHVAAQVRGKGPQDHTTQAQFKYQTSGALTPEFIAEERNILEREKSPGSQDHRVM